MLTTFLKHHIGRSDMSGRSNSYGVNGLHCIDLCVIPGNSIRLFFTHGAVDTYGNYIPTNEFLANDCGLSIEGSDDQFENYRSDNCSSMTIPLHNSQYEKRVQVLYGKLYVITATLTPSTSSELNEIERSSIGMEINRSSNRVEDSSVKALAASEEYTIAHDTLRTFHVEGATAWIEYERGPAVPAYTPVQYTYGDDGMLENGEGTDTMYAGDCMVHMARIVGKVVEQEAALNVQIVNKYQATQDVEALTLARNVLRDQPQMMRWNRDINLNSSNISRLRAITNCVQINRLYRFMNERSWNEWIMYMLSSRCVELTKTRFLDLYLADCISNAAAAGRSRNNTLTDATPEVGSVPAWVLDPEVPSPLTVTRGRVSRPNIIFDEVVNTSSRLTGYGSGAAPALEF